MCILSLACVLCYFFSSHPQCSPGSCFPLGFSPPLPPSCSPPPPSLSYTHTHMHEHVRPPAVTTSRWSVSLKRWHIHRLVWRHNTTRASCGTLPKITPAPSTASQRCACVRVCACVRELCVYVFRVCLCVCARCVPVCVCVRNGSIVRRLYSPSFSFVCVTCAFALRNSLICRTLSMRSCIHRIQLSVRKN